MRARREREMRARGRRENERVRGGGGGGVSVREGGGRERRETHQRCAKYAYTLEKLRHSSADSGSVLTQW